VGSLCAAYAALGRRTPAGLHVDLLFDYESPALSVRSPYTHNRLEIVVRQPAPLWVRLPAGVPAGAVTVSGTPEPPTSTQGYLYFARPPLGQPLALAFTLPEREIVLRHRTRDIRVRLRGEQAVAMDNFGADLTFFDPIDAA
jgi:hypothetical protein